MNGDGMRTLDDAILTLKYAMQTDIGNLYFDRSAADVNLDGIITLEDAVLILKMAMGVLDL